MNTWLNFRTQAFSILILSIVWFASSIVTLSVGEMSKYNPTSWFLVDVLPFPLLYLGTTFVIREYHQRIRNRLLFYSGAITSFLPILSTALRVYLRLHASN